MTEQMTEIPRRNFHPHSIFTLFGCFTSPTKLLSILLSALTVEVLCLPKYIILPVILLQLFGGPKSLFILPFSVWILILYLIQVITFAYPQFLSPRLEPKFKDILFTLLPVRSLPLSMTTLNSSLPPAIFYIHLSNLDFSIWLFIHIADLLLTMVAVALTLLLIFLIFIEADGQICDSWRDQYKLAVAEVVFGCISIFMRIILIVTTILLRYVVPTRADVLPRMMSEVGAFISEQPHLLLEENDVMHSADTSKDPPQDSSKAPLVAVAVASRADAKDVATHEYQHVPVRASYCNCCRSNTCCVRSPAAPSTWIALTNPSSLYFRSKFLFAIYCSAVVLLGLVYTSIVIDDVVKYSRTRNQNTVQYTNCDNMIGDFCVLPFPSYNYLVNSTATGTGLQVSMPTTTMPYTKQLKFMSGSYLNKYDGFSVAAPILFYVPNLIEKELISFQNIGKSVLLNSTTLIVNVDTGEFHAHFTELDYFNVNTGTSSGKRICYVQPASALQYDTHYAVIVQKLTTGSPAPGNFLPPSPLLAQYVAAYLAGSEFDSDGSEVDAARYRRFQSLVFPALARLNVSLSDAQLIWDFHTASQASLLQSLLLTHNSTLARMSDVLNLTHSAVYEGVSDFVEAMPLPPSHPPIQASETPAARETATNNDRANLYHETPGRASYGDCSASAASSTMASAVYYRINVPWYLTNKNVRRLPWQAHYHSFFVIKSYRFDCHSYLYFLTYHTMPCPRHVTTRLTRDVSARTEPASVGSAGAAGGQRVRHPAHGQRLRAHPGTH